jgi:hypothetical protein
MSYRNAFFALALAASACAVPGYAQTAQPVSAAATAATTIPNLIRYSGTALRSDGKAAAGQVSITFLIFKDEQGGEPLWSETQSAISDASGHYEVHLGAAGAAGVPAELFANGDARWLEVQVAGSAPQPRVLIASVAYAMKAADATTLGGLPASAFALAGGAAVAPAAVTAAVISPDASSTVTTPGGTSGYLPAYSGAATIDDSIVFESGTRIGIGTTSPATTLDVAGGLDVRGVSTLENTGTATTAGGKDSQALEFAASSYKSSTKAAVAPILTLQAEPTGNNTATPGATLNLLYNGGAGTANTETGFYLNPNGTVHFATGQTFPGTGTGSGTITGVTAGTGLTGGGTSGKVTLNVNTGLIPTLAANNTFTGSNTFVPSLYEHTDVNIDSTNANSGAISPGLRFGNGSGEGMASQRVSGGDNQYGLDFFTDYIRRLSISEIGNVGIGTVAYGEAAFAIANPANNFYLLYASGDGHDCYIDMDGDLDCSGAIIGAAKEFKIDHPLDPANKYLVHASVESSEMMNIYSGNVVTDELGVATVTLPDWFEAENGDFRYQLTSVGSDAHAWVSQEVANRQFKISTNATHVKVSWQITAVRQDVYAKAHPLGVEQTKSTGERGFYEYPELFGQPKEKGISWARKAARMKQTKTSPRLPKLQAGTLEPTAVSSASAPRVEDAALQLNAQ